MNSRALTLSLFLIMLVSLLSGCATTVDQKITLSYKPVDSPLGRNRGEVVVSRTDAASPQRNIRGEWVIGSLNNVYGVRQADLLSDVAAGEWVSDALLQELKQAGYTAAYSATPPAESSRTIVINDINAFLNVNMGTFTVETKHELKFNIDIIINGSKIKTLAIATRDNKTLPLNASREEKERIMRKSLEDAMQQVIPELVVLFNKK